MKAILKDKSFQLSIILTTIFIGTGIGFLFLGLVDYSWILFGLLPVVLGVAIGTMHVRKYALWGAIITTILLLIAIYIPGLSGIICIIMAIGLVVPFIFLGYVIVRLADRYKVIKETNKLSVLILPLLPFLIAAPTEHFLKKEKETVIEVRTEKVFNYTADEVYDAIKSVDTLDAEKPFLLKLDLPIPTKCVLEKEEVGAIRTCYFKGGRLSNADFGGGTITERVTQLERGKVLKMDVIDYNLIGRRWLGFKEAIYYFEPVESNKCKLIRITTYTSVLTPRFYWEPMEKLGVSQEHDYVFNNLEKDLKTKYRK
ncbi:polyketide cyclase [Xanthocytophaga flava]|uniref:polyketide cyclase n=1 Tax=Xanthocytophaga flava TaxID=3048013 RepID=UPI0028D3B996|nr:polyketide cyclase [Xanthocytophaga flavus]MDJ1469040.1 polyketide cyclase [Xanthocytophaga flavus]